MRSSAVWLSAFPAASFAPTVAPFPPSLLPLNKGSTSGMGASVIPARAAWVGRKYVAPLSYSWTLGRECKDSLQQRGMLKNRAYFPLVEPDDDIVQAFALLDLGACGGKGHVDGTKSVRAGK